MGKATAELFVKEGAHVIVSDIHLEKAQAVATAIKSNGGKALTVMTDVAKEVDVQKLIEITVKHFGTVDILVNHAGIMDNFIPAGELTDELWERIFAVNSTGSMRTIRKVLPIFTEK
jgi:NAD(P)-dependent dehydrogenase (short-subunit alcohol dehydrogenase family)